MLILPHQAELSRAAIGFSVFNAPIAGVLFTERGFFFFLPLLLSFMGKSRCD